MTPRIAPLYAVGLQFGLQFSPSTRCVTIGLLVVSAATRHDVEQVKHRDRDFDGWHRVLAARIRAVAGAQRALVADEEGALPALRQSLVDLAAIAELLADDLPAPDV